MSRALVIQLARLGDLVQSLPAIMALKARGTRCTIDVLCAVPLASLPALFPGVSQVIAWDGSRWRAWAARWASAPETTMSEIETYLRDLVLLPYDRAYNLNQHPRAVLTASLLAERVIGPGETSPLSQTHPPWAAYLRSVAVRRDENRVHLADAFCGLCGVSPLGTAPLIPPPAVDLPHDLAPIGRDEGPWVAVAVGAGETARCISPAVWREWISCFLRESPTGQVVLVGSGSECESARTIQDGLSSILLNRVWDATGRTDLAQLVAILSRCRWMVGADTGPLHLAAAVGARVMGFYFARARVHETGPYGQGHWVWQAEPTRKFEVRGSRFSEEEKRATCERRTSNMEPWWPIAESVELLLTDSCATIPKGWSLWRSGVDHWGAYFTEAGELSAPGSQRERVWRMLQSAESLMELMP